MDKYIECDTCAFRDEPGFTCDVCEDADQWEESFEDMAIAARQITFYQREKTNGTPLHSTI